jgi:hypothetical protein
MAVTILARAARHRLPHSVAGGVWLRPHSNVVQGGPVWAFQALYQAPEGPGGVGLVVGPRGNILGLRPNTVTLPPKTMTPFSTLQALDRPLCGVILGT